MSALKKLVSALLVLTLAVSGGLLAWHGLHRTSAAPPVGQTQTPTVPAPPASVPDTVSTLCVAGDLVMHIPIINSCRTDDGYDFTGLFDEARPYYESADYAAACIETTFNGPPYSGFPQFCAPDQLAGDLKSVGLDLLSTASNHSLDTWFSGLTRTLDVLDGAGLDHVGTYRTQEERDTVKVIDVGGIRLAVLAYTYGTNGLPKDEHPYCVNVFTTDYMTNCGEIDYELLKSDLARARQTDADAIAAALAHIDIEDLVLDDAAQTVYFTDPEMALDVGAVGKGYAVEQTARAAQARGLTSALLNIGGNVRAIGTKPGGKPWTAGVENPWGDDPAYIQAVELADGDSLVISGDYQRYFEYDGVRYAHLIDLTTGYPARYVSSVAVLARADTGGLADALSTGLFCLPEETGQALAAQNHYAVLWMHPDETTSRSADWPQ